MELAFDLSLRLVFSLGSNISAGSSPFSLISLLSFQLRIGIRNSSRRHFRFVRAERSKVAVRRLITLCLFQLVSVDARNRSSVKRSRGGPPRSRISDESRGFSIQNFFSFFFLFHSRTNKLSLTLCHII